ncbi:hypothetical protein HPP92_004517 [Vanilla planifolia]|uniref:Uncharacterized protein n=1 Tax=Vanilla planifolia TaxID=51239 RepID=A0A835VDP7_VANPL|nr:hypothetical protein HPP92_004517 [Vanilla planifolia]
MGECPMECVAAVRGRGPRRRGYPSRAASPRQARDRAPAPASMRSAAGHHVPPAVFLDVFLHRVHRAFHRFNLVVDLLLEEK